ncbi:hypothetical protein BD779DRAFT_1479120 [Infundibulicybe gibba]|nr:hypothetical protein BD779DRAFT_1479120 [Infundibulicybe gibba]
MSVVVQLCCSGPGQWYGMMMHAYRGRVWIQVQSMDQIGHTVKISNYLQVTSPTTLFFSYILLVYSHAGHNVKHYTVKNKNQHPGEAQNRYTRKRRTKQQIAADQKAEAQAVLDKKRANAEKHSSQSMQKVQNVAEYEANLQKEYESAKKMLVGPISTKALEYSQIVKKCSYIRDPTSSSYGSSAAFGGDEDYPELEDATDEEIEIPPTSVMDSESDASRGLSIELDDDDSDNDMFKTKRDLGNSMEDEEDEPEEDELDSDEYCDEGNNDGLMTPMASAAKVQGPPGVELPSVGASIGIKRKAPNPKLDTIEGKRAKAATNHAKLGGLKPGAWEKIVAERGRRSIQRYQARRDLNSVTTSPATPVPEPTDPEDTHNKDNTGDGLEDQPDLKLTLQAARMHKSSKAPGIGGSGPVMVRTMAKMGIKLEPVAAAIPTNTSAPRTKKNSDKTNKYCTADLPFPGPRGKFQAHRKQWQNQFMPRIQTGLGQQLRVSVIGEAKLGSKALKSLRLPGIPTPPLAKLRHMLLTSSLHDSSIVFKGPVHVTVTEPDRDRKMTGHTAGTKGAWLSPLILRLLAVHLQSTLKTTVSYGDPVGALALCAASLERALSLWETGVKPENKPQFNDNPWGGIAKGYVKSTSQITYEKWNEILTAATDYIKDDAVNAILEETDQGSIPQDPRATIED